MRFSQQTAPDVATEAKESEPLRLPQNPEIRNDRAALVRDLGSLETSFARGDLDRVLGPTFALLIRHPHDVEPYALHWASLQRDMGNLNNSIEKDFFEQHVAAARAKDSGVPSMEAIDKRANAYLAAPRRA